MSFCPVLAFSSDGGRILLLAFPWTSSVNERIVELRPHPRDEPIAALAWSPCDEFLTVALRDGGESFNKGNEHRIDVGQLLCYYALG